MMHNAFGVEKSSNASIYNSLLGAYEPGEVAAQLQAASLSHLAIEVISDRHFMVWGAVGSDPSGRL
jgi:hypothetical protein